MSAAVSSRLVNDSELLFGFDPGTFKGNLLLYDFETNSLWSQIYQKAISGPLMETPLKSLPTIQTSWKHWQSLYPDTTVVTHSDEQGSAFQYPSAIPVDASRQTSIPDLLTNDQLTLGVVFEDQTKAYPINRLAKTSSPMEDQIGEQEILIHYNDSIPAAWVTDREGSLLPSITTTWIGWSDFYPDTKLFLDKQSTF